MRGGEFVVSLSAGGFERFVVRDSRGVPEWCREAWGRVVGEDARGWHVVSRNPAVTGTLLLPRFAWRRLSEERGGESE